MAIPRHQLLILIFLSCLSVCILYSAAGGSIHPWASKQALRFIIGFALMYVLSKTPMYTIYGLSYILYFLSLLLLLSVDIIGLAGMGAKRWLHLYAFQIQPSEIMRVALILALARYFNDGENKNKVFVPLIMVLVPVILVIKQPDLGTAVLIVGTSLMIAFMADVKFWKFIVGFLSVAVSVPFLWQFLHDYQKKRILVFLQPDLDTQKAGYHILQSKVALGSGGLFGKGFLSGTQTHLNFLPEKQTDFVFTMFGEEFGLIGTVILISIYISLIIYGYKQAMSHKNYFAALCIGGLTSALFLYVFVNIAMVTGLLPVVGVPLPFVSYGGTSLISLMISQGIIFSASQKKQAFLI